MKTLRSPRKIPQQVRSQETVDVIIEAGARIFSETDFDTASINAIAERAGVSIGSIYQYFPSKLALLDAVKGRHLKAMWFAMGLACAEASRMSLADGLNHFVSAGVAYNMARESLIRCFVAELPMHFEDDPRRQLVTAKAAFDQQLRCFFSAYKSAIRVDVDQAVFMLPVLARGIFAATLVDRPEDLKTDAIVDQVTSVVLRYLTGA